MNSEINIDFQKLSYEDLSKKFREYYPSVIRAFELIPMMYDRLTLIDGLSHKRAIKKIGDDHKDLAGFSARNIRRYLPTGNPSIPKRIRTLRPKISLTASIQENILSTGLLTSNTCSSCERNKATIEELEKALGRASAPKPASSIMQSYYIPKEGLQEINLGAQNCQEIIYLYFNTDRYFIRAESDIGKQNLLPGEEMTV